jgi:hypothetical protein
VRCAYPIHICRRAKPPQLKLEPIVTPEVSAPFLRQVS